MTLRLVLAAAVGGFVGAPARYLVDRAVSRRIESDLPWGTMAINISGCFLFGFLTGLALAGQLSSTGTVLLGTGFCGAFTTYSTFMFETMTLIEDGRLLAAAGNLAASVGVGLGAAALGLVIASAI